MPKRALKKKDTNTALWKHALVRLFILGCLYFILPDLLFYLLCGYFIITEIGFHFPTIAQKYDNRAFSYSKKRFGFYLGAHRGGSLEGLENTLANFKKAKELGVGYVEMDVCLTKDNKVVVIHDSDLKRISGVDKKVNEYNYNDLPPILNKVPVHFDWSDFDASNWEDKKFPLFDDVCRELGDTPINMELKTREDNINEEVYKIIKKYNKTSQVVWGSKSYKQCKDLDKMAPEVLRFACIKEITSILAGYIFGYLPFIKIDCKTVQLPFFTKGYSKCGTLEIHSPIKRKMYLTAIRLISYIIDPLFVHLQRRGIEPIFWVPNTKEELEKCLQYEGLSGIMTDGPQYYIDLLEKKEN